MSTPTENWPIARYSQLYEVWRGMRQRCNDTNSSDYKNYGGRGIKVCKRWNDYELFATDMGRRPSPKHSIERIDNNKDYAPDNCKWATMREQRLNCRNTVWLEYNGERLPLTIWAERIGIKRKTMTERYRQYGLNAEILLRPQGKHTGWRISK